VNLVKIVFNYINRILYLILNIMKLFTSLSAISICDYLFKLDKITFLYIYRFLRLVSTISLGHRQPISHLLSGLVELTYKVLQKLFLSGTFAQNHSSLVVLFRSLVLRRVQF